MAMWAHSPRRGRPGQPYEEHIRHVARGAARRARLAGLYSANGVGDFRQAVEAAALLHDLGKLEAAKQAILAVESKNPLPPPPHEEAGVAWLVGNADLWPAALVAAHHRGLFDGPEQRRRGKSVETPPLLRNLEAEVLAAVDAGLDLWLESHTSVGCVVPPAVTSNPPDQVSLRLSLSCLVDADHSDAAAHERGHGSEGGPRRRWAERLTQMTEYAQMLPKATDRDCRRQRFFDACLAGRFQERIVRCEGPVGTGKTLGVMAHLLAHAKRESLRHIFVVLPFTNIIDQAVKTYRQGLVLKGEDPEAVVAALHHQLDFADIESREYAALWRAPIIVTTAAAFFETLAGAHPARLRKFHELPGSAIFLDEAHAAMPAHLWETAWKWLVTLTENWSVRVVLASGSLFRFWEDGGYLSSAHPSDIPEITPPDLHAELTAAETARVQPRLVEESLTLDALLKRLKGPSGPGLVVVNTVRTAGSLASLAKEKGFDVLHLSTALAPVDRQPIVQEIERRLREEPDRDWLLISTSCVEAGMDFSFRRAYREASTASSLIQVGGRVRRNEESWKGDLYCMQLTGEGVTAHPAMLETAPNVVHMIQLGRFTGTPHEIIGSEHAGTLKDSMKRRRSELSQLERECRYPEVQRHFRVIDADTRLVVVHEELSQTLERGEKVPFRKIVQGSVQIYASQIVNLPCELLLGTELWRWKGEYDPNFLGYLADCAMAQEAVKNGGFYG
ncbi:MAG: CRISPR-associated endonuclease Cas3'' [Fimbriimonadaceae bacterium]|nr:MAG: CRISPR-associated endonuclease Cas3'' [Fimbriimonadaceae bacterium]